MTLQATEDGMTWSETHAALEAVLRQLESLNANVATFSVESVSEDVAARWLRSESRRLNKLVGAMGDAHG